MKIIQLSLYHVSIQPDSLFLHCDYVDLIIYIMKCVKKINDVIGECRECVHATLTCKCLLLDISISIIKLATVSLFRSLENYYPVIDQEEYQFYIR